MTARHYPILRALKPVLLGPSDDAILSVDATYLDQAQDAISMALEDVFPGTSSANLSRWEALYGLTGAGTIQDRRNAVIAAMAALGGLSKPFFEGLATAMGYTITITRGVPAFRAGINAAGDQVLSVNKDGVPLPPGWDQSRGEYSPDFWVWGVNVQSVGSNSDASLLKKKFEQLKPAYSTIKWSGIQ